MAGFSIKTIIGHSYTRWVKQKSVIAITAFLLTTAALANPVLNNVASGNVSIQQAPNSTVINQSSHQAIINWQSFNIGGKF